MGTPSSDQLTGRLLDLMVSSAPVGLAFLDAELRLLRVNRTLAGLMPAGPYAGRRIEQAWPDVDPAVPSMLALVRDTGFPVPDVEIGGADWAASTTYYPLRSPAGAVLGVGMLLVDVTDRRRAEEERDRLLAAERSARQSAERAWARLRTLAAAGDELAGSLDVEPTADTVARLVVPALADGCAIDLKEGRGTRRAAVRGDTGAPEVAALPLVARGQTLGRLTAWAHPRAHDAELRLVLEELAARAALALDNAALYQAERGVVETLQASLLPDRVPPLAGARLALRYLPYRLDGSATVEVGGDFYDMVVGEDHWMVAVGDVWGKGVRAAALMGQFRAGLRAYAIEGHRPAALVERLDRLFGSLASPGFVTCVLVAYEPAEGVLRWARAGHPPPLLVRPDGGSCWLEAAVSPPVGVAVRRAGEEGEVRAEPGDLLFLYTDGLVERRGEDIDVGLERLRAAAAGCAGRDPEQALAAVLAATLPGREDDTALVVVGINP
ncbi:MAG: SpoIIE family protein phosphatase [Mycobacteriales bacterium]